VEIALRRPEQVTARRSQNDAYILHCEVIELGTLCVREHREVKEPRNKHTELCIKLHFHISDASWKQTTKDNTQIKEDLLLPKICPVEMKGNLQGISIWRPVPPGWGLEHRASNPVSIKNLNATEISATGYI
jgi:hypothetical protein